MRAYKLLLRLFPASFRAEYAGEMSAIVARRKREAAGLVARAGLAVEVFFDVVTNAVRVHLDLLGQDLRYSARTLRRSPGFTAAVVAVTALGVGATTASFSVTDHVLVRPLPFPDAERLVKLWQDQSFRGYPRLEVSPANYRDWKRISTSFEGMAAYVPVSVNLIGQGDPQRLDGASVTADLFSVLQRRAQLGRVFTEADDREGAPGTMLLSHRLWQNEFGGDPGIVGREVVLDDEVSTIIGVMPRDFQFPSREAHFWLAKRFREQEFAERDNWWLQVVARLRPEVSLDQARAELTLIAAQLEREYPKENAHTGANVVRLRDEVSRQARLLLIALAGAALCLLLIACTNLASLLLARALFRRKELAVRNALGAGRERLIRQLLTESLVLAIAGGALGVLLAAVGTPLVARLVPNALPIAATPAVDLRLLAFAAVVTALTGIGFGVLPAVRAFSGVEAGGLREGSRAGVGGARERLRSLLVAAEVTVSIVLLVSSGLLIRALWRIQAVDPGFRSEGVLTLRTALPVPKYAPTVRRHQFYSSVLSEVRALPSVSSAAYISFLPMAMRGGIWPVVVEGYPEDPTRARTASLRFVTPGFFATLGIPLRQGRDVSDSDTQRSRFVAVVSESLVQRYWPGQDPLGRKITFALEDRSIVGVVGDIRVRGLERASEPQIYVPEQQVPDGAIIGYAPKDLVLRSSLDPAQLLPAVRRIVARADPQQPISDVRTLAEIVDADTAPRAVQLRVLGGFAALAIALAGIGIHGLLAFTVSNRAQEIGVRIALGATSRDILRLVLGQGLLLAGGGAAVGLALAHAAGRSLEALLAGVSPRDAVTFLAAAAVAVAVTLLGSVLPARRAMRVDPLTVIRVE